MVTVFLTSLFLWQVVSLARLTSFSTPVLRSFHVPGAGADVSIPPAALQAARLLAEHQAADFRLGDSLAADQLLHQRIVEYTYPIRMSAASRNLLVAGPGPSPSGCSVVAARELISLHACDN